MQHIWTDAELQTISNWENKLPYKFDLASVNDNCDIVLGTAWNKFGKITPETLEAAVAISFRSLKFMPGQEHPVIKQELAKAAADKAQQKKDADELERKRKREAEVRAGIGPNQGKIRTEFDRAGDKAATDVQTVALTGVNHPKFIKQNLEAKAQFEDLVSRGPITYRNNREDRSKTEERRSELQGIQVWARQDDKNGKPVLIYSEMVKRAEEIIKRFESEDARRQMS